MVPFSKAVFMWYYKEISTSLMSGLQSFPKEVWRAPLLHVSGSWKFCSHSKKPIGPSPQMLLCCFRKCWSWANRFWPLPCTLWFCKDSLWFTASLEHCGEPHLSSWVQQWQIFAFRIRQAWNQIWLCPITSCGTMSEVLRLRSSPYSSVKWRQSCLFCRVVSHWTILSPSDKRKS
jgi:hypothetical protein